MLKLLEKAKGAAGAVPAWVWALAAVGVAAYVIKKGGISPAVADATAGLIDGAGSVVSGVAGGVVVGAGQLVGIPKTNASLCAKAKREGNNWDASFYCPASEFLEWQADGAGRYWSQWIDKLKGQ